MTYEEKMNIAVFRYGVISDLVNGVSLSRNERARLMVEKCARKWDIPLSTKTRISKSTLKRWIRLYNDSNGTLEALTPKGRSDRGKARSMDDDTSEALVCLRREMPDATIIRLQDEMEKRGLVSPGIHYPNLRYTGSCMEET